MTTTSNEMREMKAKLEATVAVAVKDFEERAGVIVTRLAYSAAVSRSMDGKATVYTNSPVLEVELP